MIKAVILDIDDTLCMTKDFCYMIENSVAVSMGHSPISKEVYNETWGQPLDDAAPVRIPGVDIEEFLKKVREFDEELMRKDEFIKIPEKNLDTLDNIIKDGYILGILTSRTKEEVDDILHPGHPLLNKIRFIHHREMSEFRKPHPRVFDVILENFGVNPDEAVYVGDSKSDAVASEGAGLHFIACLESGIRTEEDFKGIKVNAFIKKFTDLDETVKALI